MQNPENPGDLVSVYFALRRAFLFPATSSHVVWILPWGCWDSAVAGIQMCTTTVAILHQFLEFQLSFSEVLTFPYRAIEVLKNFRGAGNKLA